MTTLGGVLSYLRQLAPGAGTTEDGALLSRFIEGDGTAFTALVERHAPLVWGVCRRLLGATPDAEDAFQAVFVVLVQKAGSLGDGRPLGPWLHRVAWRTATKARVRFARRRQREGTLAAEPTTMDEAPDDIRGVLDEELERLPEYYRRPVVLCYLEGLTNEEAARQLGCPIGTIQSRLSRARERLRQRLGRRGMDLSASLTSVSPPVPAALAATVARAGVLLRGGAAAFSTSVMILAEGVVFGMFLRKITVVSLVVVALAAVASGAGWLVRRPATSSLAAAPPPAAKDKKTPPKTADTKTKTPDVLRDVANRTLIEKQMEKEKAKAMKTPPLPLRAAIRKQIDFAGYDDPKLTLGEALGNLAKTHNVAFEVDEKAFGADIEDIGDVMRQAIAGRNPIEPMKTSLGGILKKILARISSHSPAVFLLRKDHIEITTEKAARKELGMTEGEPFVLIQEQFARTELNLALETLAEEANVSILIDPRVEEKAKVKVSAAFVNAPLEAAVELLADMAGLGVVRRKNILYVTAAENARKLTKETKPDAPAGGAKKAAQPAKKMP